MVKHTQIYSAVLSLILFAYPSYEECISTTEKLANVHGESQFYFRDVPITECNPLVIIENEPLSLDEYEDYLKIENNGRLPKLYRNTFSLLTNLKSLVISQVYLEEVEEESFKGLSNLRYLNLKRNKLRTLPEHIFDDVPNLIELDLENNRLQLIQQHLFDNLKSLKKLHLSYNHITDLEDQWHTGLGNLDYLAMAHNRIDKLKNLNFLSLSNLDTLRLQNNSITKIERDAFKGLSKLRSLSFQGEGTISIDDFKHELENMPNLKELSFNPMSFLCRSMLSANEYIEEKGIAVMKIPDIDSCWE